MKKIFIICAAALAFGACVKENLHEIQKEAPKGSTICFEGSFESEAATKMVLGEKDEDGVYKMVWTKGDAIGIFTYKGSETANNNIRANLFENSEGNSKGLFVPVERVYEVESDIEGGDPITVKEELKYSGTMNESFFVYYPYIQGTQIEEGGIVRSNISKVQSQKTVGGDEVGVNGFSTGIANVVAGTNKATFNLEHQMAYVRIKATGSSFAGYQLHAAQLFDKSGEAKLSGEFDYNIAAATVTPAAKTYPSAKIVAADHDWTNAPEKSELYLTVFPGDYSAAEMYVAVTFMNSKGETYTIPMELDLVCKFPKATITTIDMGDVQLSDNVFNWYEPFEKRNLLDMYAYGSENTYMAEHKTRPVDNPDDRSRVEVVIDVKPRGDFSKVAEPKFYKLVTPSEKGCNSIKSSTSKLLYLSDSVDESKITSPAHEVAGDYTIRVYIGDTTAASGSWGVVGIYDAGMNLLWSYMVCTYMEGHPVQDIYYTSDIAVMDRWLGHPTGTRSCAEKGSFKALREPQKQNTATFSGELPYFQWGRKDPFPQKNEDGLAGIYSAQLATDETTIEDGIKNPTVHYGYSAGTAVYDTKGDWHCEGVRNDLWGGYNNTGSDWCDDEAVGHKTVFDPCPAGYRIPDARVLKHVTEKGEVWETIIQNEPLQDETYVKKDSPFYKDDGGTSVIAVKDVNGEYDYWSFAGYRGGGSKYGEGTSNNRNKGIMAWANSISNAEKGMGRAVNIEYTYWSTERHFNTRHTSRRAYRYPVRCQKIID